MQSKFVHLNIGQVFRFQEQTYQKTSPLLASDLTTGRSRMIPRSALVSLETDSSAAIAGAAQQTRPDVQSTVAAAAGHFRDRCLLTLREAAGTQDDARLQVLSKQVEQAYSEFLANIRAAFEADS